jgi:hypothetical protein
MKKFAIAALGSAALFVTPLLAQDDGSGELVVTATRMQNSLSASPISIGEISYKPPVIGFKRQADSAVRNIEIVSDSRDEGMRRREVQAMLLDAIDRAKKDGVSLVTGSYELVELTRANWQDQFPGLAGKAESDDDEDENEEGPGYEDSGQSTTIRLKVKTKLEGSIDAAQKKITAFTKAVPATGRSLIEQQGGLALTIIKPEQYRDEIYKRISEGAKHAASFYGPEYSVDVNGLDGAIAWQQVSNTEVFLYIPYSFSIGK